jgi:hypothetical protein
LIVGAAILLLSDSTASAQINTSLKTVSEPANPIPLGLAVKSRQTKAASRRA